MIWIKAVLISEGASADGSLFAKRRRCLCGVAAQKTNADMIAEKKYMEAELQRCITRNNKVADLFEKLYEDNVEGKVTDEWFLQLSYKYEVERMKK